MTSAFEGFRGRHLFAFAPLAVVLPLQHFTALSLGSGPPGL